MTLEQPLDRGDEVVEHGLDAVGVDVAEVVPEPVDDGGVFEW